MLRKEDLIGFAADAMGDSDGCFGRPIIGIASPSDPLFSEFKRTVGPLHLTPSEAFAESFGEPLRGGSVACMAFPISEKARAGNRLARDGPSLEWALCRAHGDGVLREAAAGVKSRLSAMGFRAASPMFEPWARIEKAPGYAYSVWSERHAAYAAGMGSFGLSDGFITEAGMAVRLVSFITEAEIEPDERRASGYGALCVSLSGGRCGACIRRCPVGAISEKGHDKEKCRSFVYGPLAAEKYGLRGLQTGCGLCQTGVPCESSAPVTPASAGRRSES
ncbi:MAG: hypothetical protein LBG62_04180 [Candidatus Methanoplasma sp.]|jgi:ferredoxin|nr:hypothetical protein [Candidatus Methanoplasma sp.]